MKNVAGNGKSVASIDWTTFTVKMVDNPREVIQTYLKMDDNLFQPQAWGKNGYRQSMSFCGITVYFDPPEGRKMEMGVNVQMSGKGCRTFERSTGWAVGLKNGCTPFVPFFAYAHTDLNVNFTRVDLALDDKDKLLDLDTIIDHVESDEINSRIKSRTFFKGYDGKHRNGTTVYIGAAASEFRIRFYDKAKERYTPDDQEYYYHWVRCEIVMRGKNANGFVAALANTENLGYMASAILRDKLMFIERDNDNISRCTVCDWWENFIGAVASIKLVTKEDVPHTLERSLEWVITQVAPTLSIIADAKGFFKVREILQLGCENRTPQKQAILDDYLKILMVSKNAEEI